WRRPESAKLEMELRHSRTPGSLLGIKRRDFVHDPQCSAGHVQRELHSVGGFRCAFSRPQICLDRRSPLSAHFERRPGSIESRSEYGGNQNRDRKVQGKSEVTGSISDGPITRATDLTLLGSGYTHRSQAWRVCSRRL